MTIKDKEFENFIFEQALQNAIQFKGKANPKALIGKAIGKFPDIKKDMAHYMNTINNTTDIVINKINTNSKQGFSFYHVYSKVFLVNKYNYLIVICIQQRNTAPPP